MKKFKYLALLLAAFMTISCEKDIVNNQDVDSDQTIVGNDDVNKGDNNTNNDDNGLNDVVVDWAPLELFVYLSDADGNNLLDPEYEHAYDSANIVLTYEGEEYEVINYLTPSEPKAQPMWYHAVFDSPYICHDTKGVARLTIGEWVELESGIWLQLRLHGAMAQQIHLPSRMITPTIQSIVTMRIMVGDTHSLRSTI